MTYIPGSGGGGGSISTSSDVALSNIANSEVLIYDGAVAKWKNAVISISIVNGLQSALNAKAPLVVSTNTQAGSYTLALSDLGAVIEINSSSATTITIPANASVAFPVGAMIGFRQYGTAQITIAGAAGVTLRSRGGALKTAGQYSEGSITKRAADEWIISGDMIV